MGRSGTAKKKILFYRQEPVAFRSYACINLLKMSVNRGQDTARIKRYISFSVSIIQ